MELKLDIPEHQLFPKPKKPRRRRRTKIEIANEKMQKMVKDSKWICGVSL